MRRTAKNRSKRYWGVKADLCLFSTWNCAEATVQTAQDMISKQEDVLIKASAGLEGGIVSRGSTCGVVSGGALSLALMHREDLLGGGVEAEIGLLSAVGDYVNWFSERYGTTACRERSGVDLWTLQGFIRYMIPPDRMFRCLSHTSGAMQYLYDMQGYDLPMVESVSMGSNTHPIHCAQSVLEEVRKRTGIGDPLLEKVSTVLDGGVGLQGGACGALAGAVMAINVPMGINLRDASVLQAMIAFFSGHKHLRSTDMNKTDDPYAVGKRIVERFTEDAKSIDCSAITGEDFSGWASFHRHMSSSDTCRRLLDLCISEATSAIEQYERAH
jgi:hypothetical protein